MFLPRNIIGTNNVAMTFVAMAFVAMAFVAMAFVAIINKTKNLKNDDVLMACSCLGTGVGGLSGIDSANQILKVFKMINW